MISNELLEEIIYISKQEKYLTMDLIEKIVIDSIDKCDPITQAKFSGIEFDLSIPKDPDILAKCDVKTGKITCCYGSILKYVDDQGLRSSLSNFRIVGSILHELEHLKEEYKISLNDFESKLIQNGSSALIFDLVIDKYFPGVYNKYKYFNVVKYILEKKWNLIYNKIWEICPDEKIAESEAYKAILGSVDKFPGFKDKYAFTYHKIKKLYISSLMMGYNYNSELGTYNVPLEDYLSQIERLDVENRIDSSIRDELYFADLYDIEERMKYGMPITRQDFKELKKEYLKR